VKDFLEAVAAAVAIIAAIAAWLKAAASIKEANAAKIAATLADDRANKAEKRACEALALAERTAKALEGMHSTSAAQLENEQAKAEAPGLLENWIAQARKEGEETYEGRDWATNFHFKLEKIETRAQLLAAHLAHQDERCSQVAEARLGEPFAMRVVRKAPNFGTVKLSPR
jgi:hypothetical protein